MKNLYFIALCFLLFSCNQGSKDQMLSIESFIDLKPWFDEIAQSMADSVSVVKKIYINGELSEAQEINAYPVKKDFALFRQLNIYDPANLDKYSLDIDTPGLSLFRALDDSKKVRELGIFHTTSKIDSIYGDLSIRSSISSQTSHLRFSPSGYSIRSVEKAVFKAEKERMVVVSIVN